MLKGETEDNIVDYLRPQGDILLVNVSKLKKTENQLKQTLCS